MSKLTKILTQAAILAAIGAWSSSSAQANITYSLYRDTGSGPILTATTYNLGGVTTPTTVTFDLVANIGTASNTGLYEAIGNIIGTYAAGTDNGTINSFTLNSNFTGNGSQAGAALTGGTNGSTNWGDTTSVIPGTTKPSVGSSILARSALYTPVLVGTDPVTGNPIYGNTINKVPVDTNGNVVIGQVSYTVNSLSSPDSISLAFSPRQILSATNGVSSVWYDNNTLNADTTRVLGSNGVVGTVNASPVFTITNTATVSGPIQWAGANNANWGTASNWAATTSVPTDTALFQDNITTDNQVVNLATSPTVGSVNFNTAHPVVISSTNNSQLNVTSAITLNNGTGHTISADIVLGGDVTVGLTSSVSTGTGSHVVTNSNPNAVLNTNNIYVGTHTLNVNSNLTSTGTIAGDASATLSGTVNVASTATLTGTSLNVATHTNNGTVSLSGALNTSGNLTNNGTMTINGGTIGGTLTNTATLTNTGTLTLNGTVSTHSLATVTNTGGTLAIGTGATANADVITGGSINNAGSLSINNGTSVVGDVVNTGSLTVNNNANVTVNSLSGAGNLSVIGANAVMQIAATTVSPRQDPNNAPSDVPGVAIELQSLNLTGTLDVTNHDLIIHFTGNDQTAFYQVQNWIYNGLGGVTPDGTVANGVLTSSTEGNNMWLTLADNADPALQASSFDDINFAPGDFNEILVKYTYQGDVSWGGVVNYLDYDAVDSAISVGGTPDPLIGVLSGDANLDGSLDYLDYDAVDSAISVSGNGLPMLDGSAPLSVPEPASLSLLAIGASLMLRRRSKTA